MRLQLTSDSAMPLFGRRAVWLMLALGCVFCTACSHEVLPQMEEGLVGNWQWEQTTTGTTDLTPASTGHRMRICFDRRGRARFYQDEMLVSAATFTVRREGLRFWEPARYVIAYQGYRHKQYYSVKGNELQLEEANSQTATHRYQRLGSNGQPRFGPSLTMQLAR